MSADQIVTLISTVGFPIAAACGLFYIYNKTMTDTIITLKELTDIMNEIKHDLENCPLRKEKGA